MTDSNKSISPLRQSMIDDMTIRDYPPETDVLAAQTKACTNVLTNLPLCQDSCRL